MSSMHQFGGDWTEKKLTRLEKYLSAYMRIFEKNQWAKQYSTYYVDAFAGTGERVDHASDAATTIGLFDDSDAQDVVRFYRGSARIALEVLPAFDHYIFIDQNRHFADDLSTLREEFADRRDSIDVVRDDADQFLQGWCEQMDWNRSRAVVFLDPYGMSVNWETISAIANTEAIDLWVLLPVGQAINRLLMRQKMPEGAWADRLTAFFGTEAWKDVFYRPSLQPSLFAESSDEESFEKIATFDSISEIFVRRLESVFAQVADNSLVMRNSKNVPLFVLHFAASNPRGAPTAVRIANDILRG